MSLRVLTDVLREGIERMSETSLVLGDALCSSEMLPRQVGTF